MHNVRFWLWSSLVVSLAVVSTPARAQLTELAWYRLGDADNGAAAGVALEVTLDEIVFDGTDRTMITDGDLLYSDDTPTGIASSLSASFDGEYGNHLFTPATAWHTLYPGFRVGMEAFIKPHPDIEGLVSVPFGDGNGYWLSIGEDGYFHAHGFSETPAGKTPVKFGEWQHVAFLTTGSFWQVYVDGVAQYDTLPEFNYGAPSGLATIGAGQDGFSEYKGLIDEQRVFTWSGPFNAAELLFFTLRNEGDVNEDGSVDQADYDIWRTNVGADLAGLTLLEGRALGDLDGNRQINLDDFAIIKLRKSPGVVLVPEPASITLLGLAFGLAVMTGRRRVRL
jgi:hypothetical protein